MHDTVAIAYQIIQPTDGSLQSEESNATLAEESEVVSLPSRRKSRKRAYPINNTFLQPYRKKPRVQGLVLVPLESSKRLLYQTEDISLLPKQYDFMWTLNQLAGDNPPMWVGFNAQFSSQRISQQVKIWYMRQIPFSPTSNTVVAETLNRSLKGADECDRETISCTFDLNIAKMAWAIQEEESPLYDRIFISLGTFHLFVAYFSTLGKYLAESGAIQIIAECDLLAKGSTISFLKGKCYKRCKRLHDHLSLSMDLLQFDTFLNQQDDKDELIEQITEQVKIIEVSEKTEPIFTSSFLKLFDRYQEFKKSVLDGSHGPTAKYWVCTLI